MRNVKIIMLCVVAMVLSSSKTLASGSSMAYGDCFSDCSVEAEIMVGMFGGGNAATFFWFSRCYDKNCGDDSGIVTFPSGNEY